MIEEKIFDLNDPMGVSTCVACGECVQACPTGALLEKTIMDSSHVVREVYPEKKIKTVCPFCGVGCQTEVSVKQNKILKVDGREGPANHNKLCIKGRFGYDYVLSEDRLTKPLVRKENAPKIWDINSKQKEIKD